MTEDRIIAAGRFLTLRQRDGWEFVTRPNATGVVAIIAVTEADELVLIEQHRTPLAGRVIEIPAGLVGDEEGGVHESPEVAARRELLEETGYEAESFTLITRCVSSAGLTNESVTLFRATGLSRSGTGGGVGSERITAHLVPLREAWRWLESAADSGRHIDAKVFAALAFLRINQ